jgi:hypothetical protein
VRISSAPCKPSTVCCETAFSSEAWPALDAGWELVRVKKTRQINKQAAYRRRHDRPDRRTKQKGRRKAGLFLKKLSSG